MASENETVEEIVREMLAKTYTNELHTTDATRFYLRDVCGRIESAWRREKAELERKAADALTTGAFVAEASARKPRRNCDRFANWSEATNAFWEETKYRTIQSFAFIKWLFAPVAEGGES